MESFVDKVYDKYLKNDFSVGDDNLNPKREITFDTRINVDEEIRKVHALIKENLENTKKELDTTIKYIKSRGYSLKTLEDLLSENLEK